MGATKPSRAALIPRFRCEQCAYDLSATPLDAPCPECGAPAADSLPERRPGVPWQLRRSVISWFATLWRVARAPRASMLALRMESRSTRALLLVNLIVGSVLIGIPGLITLALGAKPLIVSRTAPGPIAVRTVALDLTLVRSVWFVVLFPFIILIAIEIVARFYAPRRQPPMHPAVVWANQSLVSYTYPAIGIMVLLTSILWRLAAPDGAIGSTQSTLIMLLELLMSSWLFAMILGAVWGTIVDWYGWRVNRYANVVFSNVTENRDGQERPDNA